jgi:hypothetical protein
MKAIKQDNYFSSPVDAVLQITDLLRNEDWFTLASYYDLSDSQVEPEELISGKFFKRIEPPPSYHPGGFWQYKKPFAPGFTYSYHVKDSETIIIVYVEISIDQGSDLIQQGMQSFRMKKCRKGYKVLPD